MQTNVFIYYFILLVYSYLCIYLASYAVKDIPIYFKPYSGSEAAEFMTTANRLSC
jgi:hypothetical protein